MTTMRPAGITADRNKRILIIEWNDGHQSRYPFDGLRSICPCVECRGGHANMGQPPDPKSVRDTPQTELTMEDISIVGAYAIQISWGDGHSTGIYSWDYLRAACPCTICIGKD